MADLALVYVLRVDGDTSDADNLFVSKRITATGAEYRLSGPLAKAIEAAIAAMRKPRMRLNYTPADDRATLCVAYKAMTTAAQGAHKP